MKRQPSTPTVELGVRSNRDVALASVDSWTHTIVLEGALTRRSAHSLEVEIEQRCAEGATAIVLDLRELAYIDSIGVAVIAFRSRLCRQRGYAFGAIVESPMMRRAFAQAGVEELLAAGDPPPSVRRASVATERTGERGA
jgi:anti-anti-sigma factor